MLDFDPRDRDDDVRDIEMPWIELGAARGQDDCRDRNRIPPPPAYGARYSGVLFRPVKG